MTRINTNVQSIIARRTLTLNNASLSKSLERLSTGLRINSGRDDPAGLIASETLRASIRATSTAINNAQRADTIIAVAEGGLLQISSLLLDLENLIDASANQAGITSEEEAANQLQIDSILGSINRLADATAFGNKKLLNGELEFTTSGVNINEATGAHTAECQVRAANESEAREFVKAEFDIAAGKPTPDTLIPTSPWLNTDLVECKAVAHFGGDMPPHGMVLIPS